ncbi:MAG: 2-oxoglutarate dehydrogenase E1 component, partial [Planctomycetes bacterium]|nr:2-oxoglutarate dehydrogenase E1 component [Planctomycetota bacterium]
PLEYGVIRGKSSVRKLYLDRLLKAGELEQEVALEREEDYQEHLAEAWLFSKRQRSLPLEGPSDGAWQGFLTSAPKDIFLPVESSVPQELLHDLTQRLTSIPSGFKLHPKLERLMRDRLAMLDGGLDWAMGEHLAFATLLWDGTHIRMAGQDCKRGTFGHRHAVWVDQENANTHTPLCDLKVGQGRFDIVNSPLSEFAALGFEFGYSLSYPKALVIWEAQFGDFANGAQIIIDQFFCTSEQKWRRYSGLVLFLPHGQEGQGPEHSSARLERFLANCSQDNIQVTVPTTPAQLFHLLRRQVLRPWRRPLVVCTPKKYLRHPLATSSISEFTKGCFQEVLPDPAPPGPTRKCILCSGKVYFELIQEREARGVKGVRIHRLEQLHPFHRDAVKALLDASPSGEVLWVQEEPINQGGYGFVRDRIQELLPEGQPLQVVARPAFASPAVGSHGAFMKEHQDLMDRALGE